MVRVVERADRMRERVDRAEPFLKRRRSHRRRRHHVGARVEAAAVFDGACQVFLDQPDPFGGDAVGERVIEQAAISFQTMRQGVHASAGGDERRHADGERRIADRDLRHHARMKNDFLGVGCFVGDDRRIIGEPGDDAGQADSRCHVVVDADHVGAQARIDRYRLSGARAREGRDIPIIVRHEPSSVLASGRSPRSQGAAAGAALRL